MPWGALDDQFHNHPKLAQVDPEAILPGHPEMAHFVLGAAAGLHSLAISWCSNYLTDGHVPCSQPRKLLGGDPTAIIAELVRVKLWEITADGYLLHDYLDCNPSKAQVLARRQAEIEGGRRGGQASARARRERLGQEQFEGLGGAGSAPPRQPHPTGEGEGYPSKGTLKGFSTPLPLPLPIPLPSSQSPTHSPDLSEGTAAIGGTPEADGADEPASSSEDPHTPSQRLVAMYARERKAAGSSPTRRQKGIFAQVVSEKLQGGMKESAGQEAIRRMVRKGEPPSRFPAFVDEVEAERRRSQGSTFIPPPIEPMSEGEKEESARILREAAAAARRAGRGGSPPGGGPAVNEARRAVG